MRIGKMSTLMAVMSLVGVIVFMLAGCGSSTATGPSNLKPQQVMHIAWLGSNGTQISAIDPQTASDTSVTPIIDLTFDGLVTLDQNLNIEPWGASSMPTISADGLTYTFHLRPNQFFSDGTPVKASDYAYAITRSISPCLASPVGYYLAGQANSSGIEGAFNYSQASNCVNGQPKTALPSDAVVADDGAGTLTIKLSKPAAYFLDALSYPTSYAIEQSVVSGANAGSDEKWTSNLIASASHPTGQGGSGMFYISQYDQAGNLVLKLNPHWWGLTAGKKPYLTEIDYKIFADGDTQYAAYNTGTQFDETDGVPTAQLPTAQQQPDFHKINELATQMVAMNWKEPPFDNQDARLAFMEATNRTDITTNVLKGGQTPGWHIVPAGMPGYNQNITGPDNISDPAGNLQDALQHWNAYKTSVNGKIPTIQYTVDAPSVTAKNFAEKLQADWNQLPGANVKLNIVTFQERIQLENSGKLQLFRFGWLADYPDPQDWLTLLFDSKSSYNVYNVNLPQADQLMEAADADTNTADRMSKYNQAEQLLINAGAINPIYQYVGFYRVRQYVHNYAEDAQAQLSLDQWTKVYLTNS